MSKKKRTVYDECDRLLKRHTNITKLRRRQCEIYVISLKERLLAAQYALSQVLLLCQSLTTEPSAPFADQSEKRAFYTDCFWAFSYSLFDIVANIINVVHPVVLDESCTSFIKAAKGYSTTSSKNRHANASLPPLLVNKLQAITRRQRFNRLSRYRQCSLHRRTVCMEDRVTQIKRSAAYDATDTVVLPRSQSFICDNPYDMRPKFNITRRLEDECQSIFSFLESELIAVLSVI